MDKRVKRKWLNWLRNGRYLQARETLCTENKKGENAFCCHGVLCNIHAEETGSYWAFSVTSKDALSYSNHTIMPPLFIWKWAGLARRHVDKLALMNDGGSSFKTIANYIEKNL